MTEVRRVANPLLGVHRFFRDGPVSSEGWSQLVAKNREWESFYRDRWQHDKVVRSTHGVNCTGSCSWNVYVKDGIIAATLTGFYAQIVPLTIACLSMAVCLGLGTGAVFKMVGNEFPKQVGAVTGVVGAAGGLGGFFPPLVMAGVKTAFGNYTLGFLLLAFTGVLCLAILAVMMMRPSAPAIASQP